MIVRKFASSYKYKKALQEKQDEERQANGEKSMKNVKIIFNDSDDKDARSRLIHAAMDTVTNISKNETFKSATVVRMKGDLNQVLEKVLSENNDFLSNGHGLSLKTDGDSCICTVFRNKEEE